MRAMIDHTGEGIDEQFVEEETRNWQKDPLYVSVTSQPIEAERISAANDQKHQQG